MVNSTATNAPFPRTVVWSAVIAALAVRAGFVTAAASPDEAGFLQVAGQWTSGGDSLYGNYWVDRPPLLIALFQLADFAGGLIALRVIGCAAVALTILLSARAAEAIAGPRASRWTAATAAALLVTPLVGTQQVNGELLAAPFVAGGVLALVLTSQRPESVRLPLLAGAAAASAALVKQNMVDVGVYAVALLGAAWCCGTLASPSRLARQIAAFAAGALAAGVAVSAWTVAHGTSLPDVFQALYAFRLEAARTLSAGEGLEHARVRAASLALAWTASGLAVLTIAVVVTARRWRRDPIMIALVATMWFTLASVALGGGYWRHYLVQLVVPLVIAIGVLAARASFVAMFAALICIPMAAIPAIVSIAYASSTSPGREIGAAVAAVSRPGDTLTTLYGQPQVNLAADIPSPYPHLWSLPVKTLDPDLSQLDALLSGADAPTWLVVKHRVTSWGVDASRTSLIIATRYHPVATHSGQTIYLLDSRARPSPALTTPR